MGYNQTDQGGRWQVKFMDWEAPYYNPCWYDVVNIFAAYFGYHPEYKREEDGITNQCVRLYASEMQKRGITFDVDAVQLYRMAYLQIMLERYLYVHLYNAMALNLPLLLPDFVDKFRNWGKELGLY